MLLQTPSRRLFSRMFRVEGPSMHPTYSPGSWVRISPLAFVFSTPRRHQIVALRSPRNKSRIELKRIIGLPGERVFWNGATIGIQGIKLSEPYALKAANTPGDSDESLVLGKDEYFVAGDNRLYSLDSRSYGAVNKEDILGRAV